VRFVKVSNGNFCNIDTITYVCRSGDNWILHITDNKKYKTTYNEETHPDQIIERVAKGILILGESTG